GAHRHAIIVIARVLRVLKDARADDRERHAVAHVDPHVVSILELILDATHNPEGAAALKQNLSSLTEQPIIIAGTLGEDRAKSLMAVVSQYARELYLVAPNQDRATPTAFLKSCLDCDAIESDLSTLFPKPGCCAVGKSGDTILLTGSIYLIGEAMARIQGATSDEGSRLQDKV
ncbi:MAG: hypothetical protein VXV86_04870, partial [Verrucomicrobiota bacterium]|nr:hypothetical protein [Verrucomicrobiota bacterium]